MSRWYKLMTEYPEKEHGNVLVDVSTNGDALAFTGPDQNARIVASLTRTRLESMSANLLSLSGMQQTGTAKNGLPQYKYQVWRLLYTD